MFCFKSFLLMFILSVPFARAGLELNMLEQYAELIPALSFSWCESHMVEAIGYQGLSSEPKKDDALAINFNVNLKLGSGWHYSMHSFKYSELQSLGHSVSYQWHKKSQMSLFYNNQTNLNSRFLQQQTGVVYSWFF